MNKQKYRKKFSGTYNTENIGISAVKKIFIDGGFSVMEVPRENDYGLDLIVDPSFDYLHAEENFANYLNSEGYPTDFVKTLVSLIYNRNTIQRIPTGQMIGIQVKTSDFGYLNRTWKLQLDAGNIFYWKECPFSVYVIYCNLQGELKYSNVEDLKYSKKAHYPSVKLNKNLGAAEVDDIKEGSRQKAVVNYSRKWYEKLLSYDEEENYKGLVHLWELQIFDYNTSTRLALLKLREFSDKNRQIAILILADILWYQWSVSGSDKSSIRELILATGWKEFFQKDPKEASKLILMSKAFQLVDSIQPDFPRAEGNEIIMDDLEKCILPADDSLFEYWAYPYRKGILRHIRNPLHPQKDGCRYNMLSPEGVFMAAFGEEGIEEMVSYIECNIEDLNSLGFSYEDIVYMFDFAKDFIDGIDPGGICQKILDGWEGRVENSINKLQELEVLGQ